MISLQKSRNIALFALIFMLLVLAGKVGWDLAERQYQEKLFHELLMEGATVEEVLVREQPKDGYTQLFYQYKVCSRGSLAVCTNVYSYRKNWEYPGTKLTLE